MLIQSLRHQAASGGAGVPIAFEGRHSLATNIGTLQPITAAALQKARGAHTGTVLFCRTITDAYTFGSTYCVAEDIHGCAICLVLNPFDPRIVVDPDPALRKDTLLAIKEPHVVAYSDIDPDAGTNAGVIASTVVVWVDSPSDAVELDERVDAELLIACGQAAWVDTSAFSALECGDAALAAGDAKGALRFFTHGLKSEPANPALILGKAASLLKLDRCREAFSLLLPPALKAGTGSYAGVSVGAGANTDTGSDAHLGGCGGGGVGDMKATRMLAQAAACASEWAVAVDSYRSLLGLTAGACAGSSTSSGTSTGTGTGTATGTGTGTDTETGAQSELRLALEVAERRLRETRGEYDYARLLTTQEATAAYRDTRLRIQKSLRYKGLGVFAHSAIAAGTLLVAEPAFASGPFPFAANTPVLPKFRILGRARPHFHAKTVPAVFDTMQAVWRNAPNAEGVFDLQRDAGDDDDDDDNNGDGGDGSYSVGLEGNQLNFSTLVPPSSPPLSRPKPALLPLLAPPRWLDPYLLVRILNLNAYQSSPPQHHLDPSTAGTNTTDYPTALFMFSTRFNHGCHCTATYFFVGRTIFVRAAVDIAAGEELTVTYLSPKDPLAKRTQFLLNDYNFTCDCALCAEERRSAEYGRLQRLREQLRLLSAASLPAQGLQLAEDALPWLRESARGLRFPLQHAEVMWEMKDCAVALGRLSLAYDVALEMAELHRGVETEFDDACFAWTEVARLALLTGRDAVPALAKAVRMMQTRYGYPRALWARALDLEGKNVWSPSTQLVPLLDGIW